jgi:hypothetical protein
MNQQPVDLTTPQPPVTREAPAARPAPRLEFPQLLDRLATVAADRAAATEGAEEKEKLERVARLARELSEALSAVEVNHEPGGPRPA